MIYFAHCCILRFCFYTFIIRYFFYIHHIHTRTYALGQICNPSITQQRMIRINIFLFRAEIYNVTIYIYITTIHKYFDGVSLECYCCSCFTYCDQIHIVSLNIIRESRRFGYIILSSMYVHVTTKYIEEVKINLQSENEFIL